MTKRELVDSVSPHYVGSDIPKNYPALGDQLTITKNSDGTFTIVSTTPIAATGQTFKFTACDDGAKAKNLCAGA